MRRIDCIPNLIAFPIILYTGSLSFPLGNNIYPTRACVARGQVIGHGTHIKNFGTWCTPNCCSNTIAAHLVLHVGEINCPYQSDDIHIAHSPMLRDEEKVQCLNKKEKGKRGGNSTPLHALSQTMDPTLQALTHQISSPFL